MSGLDKIVAHITEEGRIRAEEILKNAEASAAAIVDDNKQKTFDECERIAKKADAEAKNIGERAVSSAELRKKQILLSGKQELIRETIEKALKCIDEMGDDEYVKLLSRVFEGHIPNENALLKLNKRDSSRIPQTVLDEFIQKAAEKGAVLTVSHEYAHIPNGFILDFGGIEENCSLNALIEQNMEETQDKINKKLFG